jgi:hypothetical protein
MGTWVYGISWLFLELGLHGAAVVDAQGLLGGHDGGLAHRLDRDQPLRRDAGHRGGRVLEAVDDGRALDVGGGRDDLEGRHAIHCAGQLPGLEGDGLALDLDGVAGAGRRVGRRSGLGGCDGGLAREHAADLTRLRVDRGHRRVAAAVGDGAGAQAHGGGLRELLVDVHLGLGLREGQLLDGGDDQVADAHAARGPHEGRADQEQQEPLPGPLEQGKEERRHRGEGKEAVGAHVSTPPR